jgi:hypothetical protein
MARLHDTHKPDGVGKLHDGLDQVRLKFHARDLAGDCNPLYYPVGARVTLSDCLFDCQTWQNHMKLDYSPSGGGRVGCEFHCHNMGLRNWPT